MSGTLNLAVTLMISLLANVGTPNLVPGPAQDRCQQEMYAGPDGRLTPHLVGRLPASAERVVGFEVVRGRPVVALQRKLLVFAERSINELQSAEPLTGISFDHTASIKLQTAIGFQTVTDSGIKADKVLSRLVRGRLYGSGNQVFVEIRARHDLLQLVARNQNGRSLPIATFNGKLRAASWNEIGFAAVVEDSLYIWQAGAKNVVRLLTDQGLSAARDVVLTGSNRAIVTLRNNVVLVTNETLTIVMGMHLAHCRFQDEVLYLLDSQTGWIWSFRGLSQLGTIVGDRSHAVELLKQAPAAQKEDSPQFREAARILGCEKARTLFLQWNAAGIH